MAWVLPFVTSLEILILVTYMTSGLSAINHSNVTVINITCSSIASGDGFIYQVPSEILSALHKDDDCEPGWYTENKFFSDGQSNHRGNQTTHPLVFNKTLYNITLKICIEVQLRVNCDRLKQKFVVHYKVTNDTNLSHKDPGQNTRNHLIFIGISIIAFLGVIGLVIRLCCRRKRPRAAGL